MALKKLNDIFLLFSYPNRVFLTSIRRIIMHKKLLATLLITCSFSSLAMAGGYQLQEYSIVNLGRAFGGAGVAGDDYSAVAFNPAGMMLKDTGLQLGTVYAAIRGHANGELRSKETDMVVGNGKGKLKTDVLIPSFFGQIKASEKLRIGAGVYVPFGLGTYYKKNWYGNTHAINSEISTIDTALAVAYQLTSTVSVGASAFLEYADARLTSKHPVQPTTSDLNADGWKPGYSVGIMYKPQKETRLGVSYRSKVHHNIKGSHYLGDKIGHCGTSLTFPEHVLISGYQEVGKFGLSAFARWTRWSQFDQLNIHSDVSGTMQNLPTVDEDWRNVWTIGTGVDYHYNTNWTYRAGVAFDQGAVKRPANRTARVPDSNRWQTSLGLSYTKNNWQIDAAYMHLFWKTSTSNNLVSGTYLDAKYRVHMDILGVGLQYHF